MWGLRHKETGNISAFFMHIPKTSGTRVLRYISKYYADEYEFKNILDMYNEDRVLHESIGGEPDPRHVHFPIENHAHITLDQAFCLYPNLKQYIADNNIDVFTIVRDPYERFVSCLRFIPTLMISDFAMVGKPKYEQLESHWFHHYKTNEMLMSQSPYVFEKEEDTTPYTRVLYLEEITGTKYEVTKGVTVDFTEKTWSNEHANREIEKENTWTVPFYIPKFELDEGTRDFVKWFWKDDFEKLFKGYFKLR